MEMEVEDNSEMLKAIFLPFVVTSHLIPLVDMARVFAMHGVDVTILTTPSNAAIFQTTINRDFTSGRCIRTHVVKFPRVSGLPEGVETLRADIPPGIQNKIIEGLSSLQSEFQKIFRDLSPDFIVSDMFFPWSVDAAAELGIPRLVYVGASYFSHCAINCVQEHEPHRGVDSDSESFVLPGLPHKLEMTRSQLPDWLREPNHYTHLKKVIKESEKRSYGSLFKSYYEFERDYEEHYKRVMGTKSWSVGPVSLWVNQDGDDYRGHANKEEGKGKGLLLSWLDSKKDGSVIYVSFGSMNKFSTTQLVEIAHALEHSGHDFIWVVRKIDEDEAFPFMEEFEKRVEGSKKGYLIWGWAPQLVILEHPATGAVVTHCGMNTVFETVIAGLPMVTWPLFAEQFFNERFLVDVLRIAVPVGAKKFKNWNDLGDEIVKREDIGKAIALLMGSGEELRSRVKVLSDAAKKAIQVGGSSYNNLKQLIEELKSLKLQKVNHQMG